MSIFPIIKHVEYAKDEMVFERGHEALGVVFMLSGEVSVQSPYDKSTVGVLRASTDESGKQEWVRETLASGRLVTTDPWRGCFGESSLLGHRRSHTCIASETTVAYFIDKQDLLQLFATNGRAAGIPSGTRALVDPASSAQSAPPSAPLSDQPSSPYC
jgi:CRP-like cAMP-binding protein